MAGRLIAAWVCLCGLGARAFWLPEVPEQAVAELGSFRGTPQVNGFVFVAGRYIPPPYTVTRQGNGIFINRIQVDQPAPWTSGTAGGKAPGGDAPKAADADGDFMEAAPAEAEAPAKPAADADDLFGDIGKPTARGPGENEGATGTRNVQRSTLNAQVMDKPAEKPVEAPRVKEKVKLDPAQVKRDKEAWLNGLEKLRKGYEDALGRGEVFFFSPHKRVNGNYGSARMMMGVLPQALRHSQSPQELLQRLHQGGVFFIDIGICGELYRHKTTFPLLEERLKRIKEDETLKEARRRSEARRW
jgi:hypothetical protein